MSRLNSSLQHVASEPERRKRSQVELSRIRRVKAQGLMEPDEVANLFYRSQFEWYRGL